MCRRAHARQLAQLFLMALLAGALCSTGCDKIRAMSPALSGTSIAADGQQPRGNVIPTRAPPRRFVMVVEDERSLTYIARELGVTVESLIATNELKSTTLQRGQQLHVDASPADVSRFLAKREARKERRAARERQRLLDQQKAEQEAAHKAAKLKAKRKLRHKSKRKTRGKKPEKKRRALSAE